MMIIGLKIGPVNHPNINWSDGEYRVIRRKLKKQFILIACLLVLLIIVGIPIRIVYYISAGSIINVLLMIAAKITGQEVKMDEQEENNSTTACKACSKN